MSDHLNLYTAERLRREFGPFVESPDQEIPGRVEHELVGESYRRMLAEMVRIVSHQWTEGIERSALKGFLLHGGVGIGKTTMAKRVAYELTRLFGSPDGPHHADVALVLIDGSDIARGRYGESEEQIALLFDYASEREAEAHDGVSVKTILLFDDVESLFLTRSSSGAKEWHFSQNSVFFHRVDELDTATSAVVLTTNRIDLVDEAIIDRFMPYEFGLPAPAVLAEIAREKARLQRLTDEELQPVLDALHQPGQVKSIREVERLVMRAYVDKVLRLEG